MFVSKLSTDFVSFSHRHSSENLGVVANCHAPDSHKFACSGLIENSKTKNGSLKVRKHTVLEIPEVKVSMGICVLKISHACKEGFEPIFRQTEARFARSARPRNQKNESLVHLLGLDRSIRST